MKIVDHRKDLMSKAAGHMSSVQTQLNILAFTGEEDAVDQCEQILRLLDSLSDAVAIQRRREMAERIRQQEAEIAFDKAINKDRNNESN